MPRCYGATGQQIALPTCIEHSRLIKPAVPFCNPTVLPFTSTVAGIERHKAGLGFFWFGLHTLRTYTTMPLTLGSISDYG